MSRITSRRAAAGLGIATAMAMAAGIQISSAQTAPRPLPNLQNQQQDQQYGRGNDGQYGGQSDLRGGRGFGNPQDRLERRLAFLHTRLRITPAQERAWTAFAAVLQDEARDRNRDSGRGFDDRRGAPSVVERLERREQRLADGTQRADHILGALRPLYASFSEEQKRTADRLMFMPGGARGFGDRGRGGRDDGRGGPQGRFDGSQDRDTR
jgi:hypothetical protein